tara:strand:- start:6199 stop:7158 length:960 start_codon:yes stop_codon:yes gene_type:complete
MKVGINGFGRIGRCLARHIMSERSDMELVQINASGGQETNLHLLKYDSVHGRYQGPIHEPIMWSEERDIRLIKWWNVDVVFECTGAFNDGNICEHHLSGGAQKVIISAPAKNVDRTVVYGVNHHKVEFNDHIVSNASCTTNCLAPLVKVLDENFTIKSGQMTTIHSYTGDQGTVDKRHKDLYRARAGGVNIVPTSTGAAKAMGLVYPPVEGKLKGSAIRVPTPNVSCVDLTVNVDMNVTEEIVNETIKQSTFKEMNGVIGYSEEPLVSSDFNTTKESCIFAPQQTRVVDNTMVRVLSWYDNEWAFSCRMADIAKHMGSI